MTTIRATNPIAALSFGITQSNVPDDLVTALQAIRDMWRDNTRLLSLLRNKHRTGDEDSAVKGYSPLLRQTLPVQTEEQSFRVDVIISMDNGLLPTELMQQLQATLMTTLDRLLEHPRKQAGVVFFQHWRT